MLKIENLHKIYGKYHALSGLNMTVREGALYGFVGPNGAGKTTAIKIITGLWKMLWKIRISCTPVSVMYRIFSVYMII